MSLTGSLCSPRSCLELLSQLHTFKVESRCFARPGVEIETRNPLQFSRCGGGKDLQAALQARITG